MKQVPPEYNHSFTPTVIFSVKLILEKQPEEWWMGLNFHMGTNIQITLGDALFVLQILQHMIFLSEHGFLLINYTILE